MQKTLHLLIMTAIVLIICFSCTPSKVIRGNISALDGRVATCEGYKFKIKESTPLPSVGSYHTFKPTKRKSIVNCIKLKP